MYIVYRDEIGKVCVEVDGCVSFSDGFAYFTIGYVIDDAGGASIAGTDMKIDVKEVLEIGTSF